MMQMIGHFFGFFMYLCFRLLRDYGLTIILFTLITKVILLPVSVLVQKNSIKMVQMYPEMNRIKAKCFGSKDMISEEQYRLYKKHHYHPMLDLVPVIAQLVILMGVIEAIYQPLRYLLRMGTEAVAACMSVFADMSGISAQTASAQLRMVSFLQQPGVFREFISRAPVQATVTAQELQAILTLDLHFCGFDLGLVPWQAKGISLLVPVLAAASSWLMCFTQNRSNVLQSEQSRVNQWITLLLSVGLSLYLGLFVPAGVGFYWIVSNLFSIAQMYLLNAFINPKKYIDYEALAASRQELEQMQALAGEKKKGRSKEEIAREKADYARFLAYPGKQIVFYSEKNGFYKYFKDVIEEILRASDVVIHYITGDPEDEVFRLADEQFRVYYIGENKLIVLMMKMDADIVVLTMPDLQKYHIKRSMVRDDIEYVYMDHAVASANLTLRGHALDAFDTIFATNERMAMEIRAMEEKYGLPKKTVVKYGYSLIDNMIADYAAAQEKKADTERAVPQILIAPSWQDDNIMDSCIEKILDVLGGCGYHITVRPHPQYVRHFEEKLRLLEKKYAAWEDIELQTDFSSNQTVFDADVLITDWSGIAYEYAFTTLKPVLFVNTPMKVMNPDYREIDVVPFDIEARDQVGISVEPDALDTLPETVQKLLTEEVYAPASLKEVREKYLYHAGDSAKVGARYLLRRLAAASEETAEDTVGQQPSVRKGERPGAAFLFSVLILFFPVMMVWVLGPLEIFAGNLGELFFGTGDFFWMFLGASLGVVLAGALVLMLFPKKLREACHTLIFAVSMMCYVQNLFLNKQLIKTDGSKVDWSLFHDYTIVNTIVWIGVILGICVFSFLLKKRREKVMAGISAFFLCVQAVAVGSLLCANPYRVNGDKMYALSNAREFSVAPGSNIILLILDRYGNKVYDNMLEEYPEAEGILKDFTYYTNANSKYNYTFPSIPYMLTLVDPDCTMTTNAYKEMAWQQGRSAEFHELLRQNGYTYNFYTGSGSAVYRDPSYLLGSVDNVEEIPQVSYVVHHKYLFYIMTKTSLLKYAPYAVKPKLEVQSFYFDGIVSFEGLEACISDNGEYYDLLRSQGLKVDAEMENALIITHLTGIHNPLTIDEHVQHVPDDSVSIRQVQLGLNIILEEYFRQLKALGVYDDATIIITADHGQYRDTLDCQPIFFVKPAGQVQDAMTRTDAPVSSEDFLPTVLDVIGEEYGSFGTSIFDHCEGECRERSTAFPHAGFDVFTYVGNRDTLSEQIDAGEYTRMEATEDWD
ncbi:MAG: membrane protein insertase YidC [Lachnospiraceae bacterium]|nr:membrane protein insertase YidC [Lachnospiraceae bacterium]